MKLKFLNRNRGNTGDAESETGERGLSSVEARLASKVAQAPEGPKKARGWLVLGAFAVATALTPSAEAQTMRNLGRVAEVGEDVVGAVGDRRERTGERRADTQEAQRAIASINEELVTLVGHSRDGNITTPDPNTVTPEMAGNQLGEAAYEYQLRVAELRREKAARDSDLRQRYSEDPEALRLALEASLAQHNSRLSNAEVNFRSRVQGVRSRRDGLLAQRADLARHAETAPIRGVESDFRTAAEILGALSRIRN